MPSGYCAWFPICKDVTSSTASSNGTTNEDPATVNEDEDNDH